MLTLGAPALLAALVFNQITLLEPPALYLLAFALLIGLSYGSFSLTSWLIPTHVPDAPGRLDSPALTHPDAN